MKSLKKIISENSQVEIRDYGIKGGAYGERIEVEIKGRGGYFEIIFNRGELEEVNNLIRDFLNDLGASEVDKRSDP